MCVSVKASVEICALGTHREFILQIIQDETLTECSAERLTLAACVCMCVGMGVFLDLSLNIHRSL